jgi:hypothetical protein
MSTLNLEFEFWNEPFGGTNVCHAVPQLKINATLE